MPRNTRKPSPSNTRNDASSSIKTNQQQQQLNKRWKRANAKVKISLIQIQHNESRESTSEVSGICVCVFVVLDCVCWSGEFRFDVSQHRWAKATYSHSPIYCYPHTHLCAKVYTIYTIPTHAYKHTARAILFSSSFKWVIEEARWRDQQIFQNISRFLPANQIYFSLLNAYPCDAKILSDSETPIP